MTGMSSMPVRTTRVAAYALCLEGPRVLLARCGSPNRPVWTLPGGAVEFGEEPPDAVRREVLVGTGLVVQLAQVIGIDSMHSSTPVSARRRVQHETHGVRIVYAGRVVGGLAPLIGARADERFAWVMADELTGRRRAELVDTAVGWSRVLSHC